MAEMKGPRNESVIGPIDSKSHFESQRIEIMKTWETAMRKLPGVVEVELKDNKVLAVTTEKAYARVKATINSPDNGPFSFSLSFDEYPKRGHFLTGEKRSRFATLENVSQKELMDPLAVFSKLNFRQE